jgi:heme/copper-type cytochrome/quinol oxidase subunit 2
VASPRANSSASNFLTSHHRAPMKMLRYASLAALFCLSFAGAARAEDLPTISILLKNHKFTPAEVHVPTGKPVMLLVTNADDTADEFEMLPLAIEKVIQPGDQGKIRLRPLGPGRFPFQAEFHAATAQGVIVSE